MSSPENHWLSPGRLASVLNPSSSTSGELLPKPPDPPDPSLPPSVTDFPHLLHPPSSSTSPKFTTVTATVNPNTALQFSFEILQEPSTTSSSTDPHLVSDVTMSDSVEVPSSSAEDVTTNSNTEPILITIPPKNSSPILTNKAYAPSPSSTKPLASKPDPNLLSSNPSSPSSNADPVHLNGYSPHVSMDVAVVEKSPIPSDAAPDVVNLAPSVDVADELPPPTEPLKADEPNPLPVVTAESQEIPECTIDAFEFPLVTSPPSSPIRSSVFPFTPDPLSPQSPQLP
ncbi:hypothetical protein Bca4012_030205 [Brassica carinata]|uniref:Uncharacterized protein n=1 Tax=Brassica carinata TaxID=52824 RepID=A0A8X7RGI8_BRACI|nr:hypothetical protein Bca52824_048437 [Brassica carinata]